MVLFYKSGPLRRTALMLGIAVLGLLFAGKGSGIGLALLRLCCGGLIAFRCLDWWRARQRPVAGCAKSPAGGHAVTACLPALVAYIDANQRYRFCNDSHGGITDVDPASLVGKTVCEVFGSSAYAVLAPELGVALQGSHAAFERVLQIGARRVDAHVEFVPDVVGGQVRGVYAVVVDLSARKRAEAQLGAERAHLRAALDAIADAVIITDVDGGISYMNPAAEALSGWAGSDAVGLASCAVLNVLDSTTRLPAPGLRGSALAEPPVVGIYRNAVLARRSGECVPIDGTAAAIADTMGGTAGAVVVLRDVTEACSLAAELTYQASHDALTGLINRREFELRVERAAAGGRGERVRHAMLYLDLDQFKIVNDTCGHVAGDALLRQLSRLLQASLRQSDTLGRLGGDEFGVLLEYCSEEAAVHTAEKLRRTVKDFNFVWRDKFFPIGVSIGLIGFGGDDLQMNDLLRMADAACYLAKDKGRNQVRVFKEDDLELMQRQGELDWASRIHRALSDNRFVLYVQKIRALGSNGSGPDHYEVLLRMRGEDGSVIPPMAFLPAAERYGLMGLIDRWVVRHCFLDLAERNPPGHPPHDLCAINLSGASLCDPGMLAYICEQFELCQVAPQAVCFEITETAAISNLADANELIQRLAAMGCKFALDDFGSGMSSFAYLKHLPVDYLKIDGEFVKDMVADPIDRAMVAAINQIGHVMGIQTIAEFVESDAILDALGEMGIDCAQGYTVQVPQPMLARRLVPAREVVEV
ncbi:EAL domain-containing protein [Rugamonas aquatica]|nr:EAL domain-containing protein [Rugamonas aquatica]